MLKFPVPHRSSTHRLACLALYRALLKQSLAISATHSEGVKSLIRRRFKTDRLLKSPSQIANGLRAGKEVLKHLCACVHGETSSITRLSSLIESTLKLSMSNEAHRNALRSTRALTTPRPASRTNDIRRIASKPVLERPLPLSEIKGGKRRVPHFMVAQGIPILVYSKPQSPYLGRVLRQKRAWQVKNAYQHTKLTEEVIPLASAEDAWDTLVALQQKQEGIRDEKSMPEDSTIDITTDTEPWMSAARLAEATVDAKYRRFKRRNLEISRQMVEILKQERTLAANEKAELESQKYEKRALKRAHDSGPQCQIVKDQTDEGRSS